MANINCNKHEGETLRHDEWNALGDEFDRLERKIENSKGTEIEFPEDGDSTKFLNGAGEFSVPTLKPITVNQEVTVVDDIQDAKVEADETEEGITLSFSLPKGERGPEGPRGQTGYTGERGVGLTVDSDKVGKETILNIKNTDGVLLKTIRITDGNEGHNPCLGRFSDVNDLPDSAQNGDYAYVDTTENNITTTKVYHYTNTWDAGTTVDVSNLSFNTGEAVTNVKIDKNFSGGENAVLSAELGKALNEKLYGTPKIIEEDYTLMESNYKFNRTANNAVKLDEPINNVIEDVQELVKQGATHIIFTQHKVNNDIWQAAVTFLKKELPYTDEITSYTYNDLVEGGYLCDNHTEKCVAIYGSNAEIVEREIPEGCSIIVFTKQRDTDASSVNRLPDNVKIRYTVLEGGDINELHNQNISNEKVEGEVLGKSDVVSWEDKRIAYDKMSILYNNIIIGSNADNRHVYHVNLSNYKTVTIKANEEANTYFIITKKGFSETGTFTRSTFENEYAASCHESSTSDLRMIVEKGTTKTINLSDDAYRIYIQRDWSLSDATDAYTPEEVVFATHNENGIIDNIILYGYNGLSFSNGTMREDCTIAPNNKVLISNALPLDVGYTLNVNNDYRIYKVHLVDVTKKKVINNIGDFFFSTIDACAAKNYRYQSCAKKMPGFAHVIEIIRADKNDISPKEDIIDTFFTYNNIQNMGYHAIMPENTEGISGITNEVYTNFKKKSDIIQRVIWTPIEKVYASNGSKRDLRFKEGDTVLGINYSEPSEWSKYIPQHVHLRTFLTALQNKHSVMYTEQIDKDHSKSKYNFTHHSLEDYAGAYYGTVCTGMTTYLAGLDDVITSDYWASSSITSWAGSTFKSIYIGQNNITDTEYNNVIKAIQPMDFIWNSGHVWAIKEVFENDCGDRIFVITEQSSPYAKERLYTTNQLIKRLRTVTDKTATYGKTWLLLRKKDWSNYPEINEDDYKNIVNDNICFNPILKYKIDPDITTFAGEYAAFLIGSSDDAVNNAKIYLNVHRGNKYTNLIIYDDSSNTTVDNIDISGNTQADTECFEQETIYSTDTLEDWIRVDLTKRNSMKNSGKFKARLTDNNLNTSGYTYLQLVSIDMQVTPSDINPSINSFTVKGGKPYLVRSEEITGMAKDRRVYITDDMLTYNSSNDSYSLNTPIEFSSGGQYIKLYVKADYGVVVKRLLVSSIDPLNPESGDDPDTGIDN